MHSITGNYIDLLNCNIIKAEVFFNKGVIEKIVPRETVDNVYILPGLVDSHVHIESSMLTPLEFSRVAVKKGTVAVVSDPHEIANVCGVSGIDFMIENGKKSPMKFYFGAPSCVPATNFETTGHKIGSVLIEKLMQREDIYFLAEMMNYPGVIYKDSEVHKKLESAKRVGKTIDGHAPGLNSAEIKVYAESGIETDHECTSIEEAKEKIALGMKILIREGSAAKNFEALYPLIEEFPEQVMFCTDDCHPDNLIEGHINIMVKRALEKGVDFFKVLKVACVNPVKHYNLDVGLLQVGDPADMIIVNNLNSFEILKTIIAGVEVYNGEKVFIPSIQEKEINNFFQNLITEDDLKVKKEANKINVIEAFDGDLLTKKLVCDAKIENGNVVSDTEADILKIAVVNRFSKHNPSVGFVKNFGLKKGAIAGSIAHDSHNIIAIGVDDKSLHKVIKEIQDNKGGISLCDGEKIYTLPLPVGGLMANEEASKVASMYKVLNERAHQLGSKLNSPFMTMAFMALLVIPEFKIGDKGLFDGIKFEFDSLFVYE